MRFKSKEEVRQYVWKKIEPFCDFPSPYGRIPNFRDAKKACERIRELEEYHNAELIFSAPDSVLLRLREIVLEDGKTLLAVLPRMKGFVVLKEKVKPTIDKLKLGKIANFSELRGKVSIFAQGCVAVDIHGNRIGKGTGFGDREFEILKKEGVLADKALFVVVAHDIQVFGDLSYLAEAHDVKADVILTPTRVIRTQ
ncbi:MAG: 5-formyltetrahydrofolate cyclo-ligase [Candidatus Aenigmarchaeota archaeon]|nr:5-formyltetrahydrofolate cyclo-ligase [Candidatus Aenigmarchaeota archaeon]MDW8149313.1 5-formyltetrahydrofolate cyclo-ligase [Candidatus Aenigmarchaeota archaeon]